MHIHARTNTQSRRRGVEIPLATVNLSVRRKFPHADSKFSSLFNTNKNNETIDTDTQTQVGRGETEEQGCHIDGEKTQQRRKVQGKRAGIYVCVEMQAKKFQSSFIGDSKVNVSKERKRMGRREN